eukprot:3159191-Prymnesium_polylepis.1
MSLQGTASSMPPTARSTPSTAEGKAVKAGSNESQENIRDHGLGHRPDREGKQIVSMLQFRAESLSHWKPDLA